MIQSHAFDDFHPSQTRAQWIQEGSIKCERQEARLYNIFEKSYDGGVTTCGQADP